MPDLPVARHVRRAGETALPAPQDYVTLDFKARLLRHARLAADSGALFSVELDETIAVEEGDCFQFEDGALISVVAAAEPLLAASGDLARLAWHLGTRHTPCMIERDRLILRPDRAAEALLVQMGASVVPLTAPFVPEPEARAPAHGVHHHAARRSAPQDDDEPEEIQ